MTKAAVASNTQGGVGLYGGVLAFGAYSNIVLMPEVVEAGHCDCLAKPREALRGVSGALPAVAPVPWAGGGKHRVVSVICDTMWKAGTPPAMAAAAAGDEAWQAANPRAIARAQLEKLCRLGFTLKSAHEYEFRCERLPSACTPIMPRRAASTSAASIGYGHSCRWRCIGAGADYTPCVCHRGSV